VVRLLSLILALTFGSASASAVASNILDNGQRSKFFIELDQSDSLTTSDLILDILDDTLSSKVSIPRISSHAYYYQQAAFLFELDVCNNESIRAPPYHWL
jgi:hypothetical protein